MGFMSVPSAPPDTPVEQEQTPAVPEPPTPEVAPDATPDESAAPASEESAPEGEPAPPAPEDPIAKLLTKVEQLEQRLTEKPQRSEADIEADIRRQEQWRRDQDESRRIKEQADREEMQESIGAVLLRQGYDVQPDAVTQVAERFINKRYDQIANRTAGEVQNALVYLNESFQHGSSSRQLTAREAQYASQLMDSFQGIMGQLETRVTSSGEWVRKADIPKLVKAEVERQNGERRAAVPPLRRPEGQPQNGRTDREILADPSTPITTIMEIRNRQKRGG